MDANRARFQPKMWDEMLRLRILESYNPPDELLVYFHRTQEEIDEEEAKELMLATGKHEE